MKSLCQSNNTNDKINKNQIKKATNKMISELYIETILMTMYASIKL